MPSTILPPIRTLLKRLMDGVALVVTSPAAALCTLERRASPGSEFVFLTCVHTFALMPGTPGAYLRRAFYRLTLDHLEMDCFIGFGVQFTHREVIVESGVYIGTWALVGSSHLREGTSIGSRVSLLSGTQLHLFEHGRWTPFDREQLHQIEIGPHTFVGEGAIVMADVGAHAMVTAGAVVANTVPAGVCVAGNPARFVKRLDIPTDGSLTGVIR